MTWSSLAELEYVSLYGPLLPGQNRGFDFGGRHTVLTAVSLLMKLLVFFDTISLGTVVNILAFAMNQFVCLPDARSYISNGLPYYRFTSLAQTVYQDFKLNASSKPGTAPINGY